MERNGKGTILFYSNNSKFSPCCHAFFANQVYYSSSRSFPSLMPKQKCQFGHLRYSILVLYLYVSMRSAIRTFRIQCKVNSRSNSCIMCFSRLLNLRDQKSVQKRFAKVRSVHYRFQWFNDLSKLLEKESLTQFGEIE